MKLVTVWSAEDRDRHGMPRRDADSTSCNAGIESIARRDTDHAPAPFAARVLRELERRGFGRAARRVVLGDGAAWIWSRRCGRSSPQRFRQCCRGNATGWSWTKSVGSGLAGAETGSNGSALPLGTRLTCTRKAAPRRLL